METFAKLNTGVIIIVIGMVVVFAVLIFLSFMFKMMELVFAKKYALKPEPAAVAVETTASGKEGDISSLVAVISAAVVACAGSKRKLVVRSIRRAGDSVPVWGRTGRQDQMLTRIIE